MPLLDESEYACQESSWVYTTNRIYLCLPVKKFFVEVSLARNSLIWALLARALLSRVFTCVATGSDEGTK